MEQIMEQIGNLLIAGILALISWAMTHGIPLLKSKLKETMHFRGSGVVVDAIGQAVSELGLNLKEALKDGRFSSDDKELLKGKAREIAARHLGELGGFYKKDLTKWIDEQLEAELGKLQIWVAGKGSNSGSENP